MRPHDIELLTVPGAPTVCGDVLLFGTSRPDLGADAYRGGLLRLDLSRSDGSATADPAPARPFTHGDLDTVPVISPDGQWVAFLRSAEGVMDAAPQLHVMPLEGGEPRRLTELPLGAGRPAWSPDSRRIAFTARVPEPGRYGVEGADGAVRTAGAESPRRFSRLDYRFDDIGFLADRPARLFLVDLPVDNGPHGLVTGNTEPLTDARVSVHDPAWTPDGQHVVVAAMRAWGERESLHDDLYAIPVAGGDPVLIVRTEGNASSLVFTADGQLLYLGGAYRGTNAVARNDGLWRVTPTFDGELASPRRLTDAETVHCEPKAGAPVVDGDRALVAVLNRGAVELRAVPLRSHNAELDELDVLAGKRAAVTGFAASDGRVVCTVSTPDSAGEIVLLDGTGSRVLTALSAPLRDAGLAEKIELTGTAPDGYPVHGWLVRPSGPGPHPVLLTIHGGPFRSYDWGLFDEAQVYAAAGYAVVLPNPRGSAGYGQAHGRSIIGRFGTDDVLDVLALLDLALARPDCDESRVGVMGGSYGGFLTSWLAAWHGDRFRAAWSERAVNAWDSFAGSSDIGWWFTDAYCGADPEVQRANSPLSYAERIEIPFLVAHSEQDWRCPLEQAQRMFVALRRNGVSAELLLFPGEGHELTRSGKPRHRVQRFEAVLEWWQRHLG
ncbi:dipeptidyl aminopeptidase/acylaminoacyl peptidase [Tamaricihabitans halophyticus]|uniref:Dipeptidyl aminopeptidase/acylaminoacyl peptidase n=1 Tax=Tamaricihabitans halophyticus TaxID=1262583 RepID=A0A4R2QD02_9PSEU|nr:S9 family peptidase [Tamaricihabitans halophyticus]TCP44785.1 dipeptidyl aminopeptidase/acylaminoacyl peptidase [Tamaricihabitans halophyticus]